MVPLAFLNLPVTSNQFTFSCNHHIVQSNETIMNEASKKYAGERDGESKMKENEKKEKIFSTSFIFVVIGQIISLFGNGILRFALPLHLLNITGSPALYGLVSALAFIPIVLLTPIGGLIADRVNKRNIMVCLDFSVATIMTVFFLISGKVNMVVLLMIVLMMLYGIAGAYQPAVQASIPLLVKEEGIVPANAIINIVSSLAGLVGPIIGGVCYSVAGLQPIVLLSIVCFTLSAVMELFIKMQHVKTPSEGSMIKVAVGDMKESIYYVKEEQPIIIPVLLMCVVFNAFVSAFLMIALPTMVTQMLHFAPDTASRLLGVTEAVMACGGLCGGICSNAVSKKMDIKNIDQILIISAVSMIPMGIVFLLPTLDMLRFVVIAVSSFLVMACATIFSIIAIAYIQKNVPERMVGKIIALSMAVSNCACPIGQSVYGLLLQYCRSQLGWMIIAVAVISAGLAKFFGIQMQSKMTVISQAEKI